MFFFFFQFNQDFNVILYIDCEHNDQPTTPLFNQ